VQLSQTLRRMLARPLWPLALPLLGALALAPAGPAGAVSVSPMLITLPVAGRDQVRLDNDGARTVTVEIKAYRRSIDEAGAQTLEPADAEFIVFPPFAAVPAGRAQLFQVQHALGALKESQSYYLNVKQLPVDVEPVRVEGGGELTFLFAFNVAVNVVPQGAAPELAVEAARQADGGLEVVFVNRGSRFVYLRDAEVRFRAGGVDAVLDEAGRAVLADQNVLEPGKRRRVVLPLPAGIAGEGVRVDVTLAENYR
jgi:fimbrial chaperone protein